MKNFKQYLEAVHEVSEDKRYERFLLFDLDNDRVTVPEARLKTLTTILNKLPYVKDIQLKKHIYSIYSYDDPDRRMIVFKAPVFKQRLIQHFIAAELERFEGYHNRYSVELFKDFSEFSEAVHESPEYSRKYILVTGRYFKRLKDAEKATKDIIKIINTNGGREASLISNYDSNFKIVFKATPKVAEQLKKILFNEISKMPGFGVDDIRICWEKGIQCVQFKNFYGEAVHEMPERVNTYRINPGSMSPRYNIIDDEIQMSRYDKIVSIIYKHNGKVTKSDPGFRGRFEIVFKATRKNMENIGHEIFETFKKHYSTLLIRSVYAHDNMVGDQDFFLMDK